MKPLTLSRADARRAALSAQGLGARCLPGGAAGVLARLGYVQIDSISVVERAHHHVFYSRDSKYHPKNLAALEAERRVFEYWWHAAAYLLREDYRFCLPRMLALRAGEKFWFARDKRAMRFVYDRIRSEGALRSSDFKRDRSKSGPWWDWDPIKRALERLFQDGRLAISRRDGFQKVYDLSERVLPESVHARIPTPLEHGKFLVQKTLAAHAFAGEREIGYLQRPQAKKAVKKALSELAASGDIIPVRIEGSPDPRWTLKSALKAPLKESERCVLLSPFDNSLIQRLRLKELFDFDYAIECYLPASKRRYGYFSLPILYGDRFIGRLDPKADRRDKILRVRSLHLEKPLPDGALEALKKALEDFAAFNGCESIAG